VPATGRCFSDFHFTGIFYQEENFVSATLMVIRNLSMSWIRTEKEGNEK